jgi:hypothetical protein
LDDFFFLLLDVVEVLETVRNFALGLLSTESVVLLLVCAASVPQTRTTAHPVLSQFLEMAPPNFRS